MSTKKRVILSAAQKNDICQAKEMNPNIKNIDLANKYQVGKSTITDILKEKERWLATTEEEGKVKKFRGPKWPKLEEALGLWVDNTLNSSQDIDGHILKTKANDMDDELKLTELIGCLSTDDTLTTYEYIHAEDDEVKGGLTEEEILEIKVSYAEAEICVDKTLRFLYEQGPEFEDVEEEVKILRKLHKQ
ncbi:16660_t:CDS:2, partial [Cetraspora pellucida]